MERRPPTQKSWFDKMVEEQSKDPREIAIREMIDSIVEVKKPKRIVPIEQVPEFSPSARRDGLVSAVIGQGRFASTVDLPIRTDNAAVCNIFLIESPTEEGKKYTLVHVWAGDLELNLEGYKRKDLAAEVNNSGRAIGITGGMSSRIISTARELKYEGVDTKKHIAVESGRGYVSVVYKPKENEILIRIGSDEDATEVWVYDGFE